MSQTLASKYIFQRLASKPASQRLVMPGKKKADAPFAPMEITLREEKSIVAQVRAPAPTFSHS